PRRVILTCIGSVLLSCEIAAVPIAPVGRAPCELHGLRGRLIGRRRIDEHVSRFPLEHRCESCEEALVIAAKYAPPQLCHLSSFNVLKRYGCQKSECNFVHVSSC